MTETQLDTVLAPPGPEFEVVGARRQPHAAAPTLVFTVRVGELTGREVYTIALSAQIHIDPARRSYDSDTHELLVDMFGAPERWPATTTSFLWTRVDVLVPPFTGEAEFDIPVLCNYDLEVAATKYFYALPDGEVPLSFHFTGTIFYRGDDGRLQLVQVPWSCSARFALPVSVWREMIEAHYVESGWIRLATKTLDRLHRRRAARGLPSFDACVTELLDEAES